MDTKHGIREWVKTIRSMLADYLPLTGATIENPVTVRGGLGTTVAYRTTSSDATGDLAVGVDSGGVNHGLYSFTQGKWLIHADRNNVYLDGKNAAHLLELDSESSFLHQVATVSYSSNTTWTKIGTVSIPHAGIYRIRAIYGNAAVRGVAISATSATQIYQTTILAENATGASIDVLVPIATAGDIAIWTVCNTTGRNNNVQVYSVVVPAQ